MYTLTPLYYTILYYTILYYLYIYIYLMYIVYAPQYLTQGDIETTLEYLATCSNNSFDIKQQSVRSSKDYFEEQLI